MKFKKISHFLLFKEKKIAIREFVEFINFLLRFLFYIGKLLTRDTIVIKYRIARKEKIVIQEIVKILEFKNSEIYTSHFLPLLPFPFYKIINSYVHIIAHCSKRKKSFEEMGIRNLKIEKYTLYIPFHWLPFANFSWDIHLYSYTSFITLTLTNEEKKSWFEMVKIIRSIKNDRHRSLDRTRFPLRSSERLCYLVESPV